jgi:hypothetical protein
MCHCARAGKPSPLPPPLFATQLADLLLVCLLLPFPHFVLLLPLVQRRL